MGSSQHKGSVIIKLLSDYQLADGTIYHFDDSDQPEFGDGLARYCSLMLCEYMLAQGSLKKLEVKMQFQEVIKKFYLPNGEPIRHYSVGWWSLPGNASGDQIEPLLCCYLVMGMKKEFWDLTVKILKRGGFAFNTRKIGQWDDKKKIPDFIGLRISGLVLRYISSLHMVLSLLTPIIALWDLALLVPTTLVRTFGPILVPDNTGDDLNYFHKLIAYFCVGANPVSYMCRNLYYALRPPVFTNELGCVWAFKNYYAGPKNPPLDIPLSKVAAML